MADKSVRVTISKDIEKMFFAVQKQMKSCEKKEDKHHAIGGE